MSNVRLVIYHNPSCSKSRETLQILDNNNLSPTIVEYLDNPPTRQELKKIIAMLDISARELQQLAGDCTKQSAAPVSFVTHIQAIAGSSHE